LAQPYSAGSGEIEDSCGRRKSAQPADSSDFVECSQTEADSASACCGFNKCGATIHTAASFIANANINIKVRAGITLAEAVWFVKTVAILTNTETIRPVATIITTDWLVASIGST
jgi:hypothetical protein